MKKVLITGANGFIGHNLIKYLINKINLDIIAADRNFDRLNDLKIKKIEVDLLNLDENCDLFSYFCEPDVLIHLAWQDGFNHNSCSHINNLPKHYHFLKKLIDGGCRSISVMGSMHEVGKYEGMVKASTPCLPLSNYGIAKNTLKQIMSIYCDEKQVSFKWLRAYYITGDDINNHSIFSKILEYSKEGINFFPFTSGENMYDFLDIKDVSKQIAEAALQSKINGIIEICSGKPVSLKEKVEAFIRNNNLDISPQYGVYPSRKYDSRIIFGDSSVIKNILSESL